MGHFLILGANLDDLNASANRQTQVETRRNDGFWVGETEKAAVDSALDTANNKMQAVADAVDSYKTAVEEMSDYYSDISD